ncbi:hypothetical protein DNK49_01505 [Azoarcus communis]|uniref:Cysteine-rich CWC family protein n=2 Tax=Parazoarcus communis TaxID=41977 RepID=A0A323V068_9RHOO|nr:cysteine-rich CWC family protein [Parazoarcus communis]NMG70057.1 hypothetical protein [Parazoarcus communis SWub3 = DSM 12120]PZA18239.1 hypothetical protein DNK49_01505 [Azoarcus communis] [Parazoarcus communis SWub3 = DSM 12120]
MANGNAASASPVEGDTCPRCGASFSCGMRAGDKVCWCAAYPPAFAVPDAGAGCFCPTCLAELIAQAQAIQQ